MAREKHSWAPLRRPRSPAPFTARDVWFLIQVLSKPLSFIVSLSWLALSGGKLTFQLKEKDMHFPAGNFWKALEKLL